MGQRAVGATILAAGLAGIAVVLLADAGATALVLVGATCVSGLLVLRQVDADTVNADTINADSVRADDDGPEGPPFATTVGDDGRTLCVARDEVEAVFGGIRDRWRGIVALRLGDDAAGPPARLDAAVVELRGDILRAEAYLDALRFPRPGDREPYDDVVGELEALLRRIGDPDWGRGRRDGR